MPSAQNTSTAWSAAQERAWRRQARMACARCLWWSETECSSCSQPMPSQQARRACSDAQEAVDWEWWDCYGLSRGGAVQPPTCGAQRSMPNFLACWSLPAKLIASQIENIHKIRKEKGKKKKKKRGSQLFNFTSTHRQHGDAAVK